MPPLQYDDVPGSWGPLSEKWVSIGFTSVEKTDRAFVACSKEHVVPYGSYVRISDDIMRVETSAMAEALHTHLSKPDLLTYEQCLNLK